MIFNAMNACENIVCNNMLTEADEGLQLVIFC